MTDVTAGGPRPCPECGRSMSKVCPLGLEVGGFIWQCPSCKTVVADWTPIEPRKCPSCQHKLKIGKEDL